jgi:FdhE protein
VTIAVDGLKHTRPEWSPWLAVVEEALAATDDGRWERIVPEPETDRRPPLLDGSSIVVDEAPPRDLLTRLIRTATKSGTPKMATLDTALGSDLDVPGLFAASICHDRDRIAEAAALCGADEDAFQAIVALLAIPFLQACNRRWMSPLTESFSEGYCPICGSWPALAEVRGIQRNRYLRCARCGSEWLSHILHCAYCGTTDHEHLASLVPEKAGSAGSIEACRRCHTYLKVFTRLQGSRPTEVMLQDLASVDFDVAALEQGYARPVRPGRDIEISVTTTAPQFLPWNL